MSTRRWEDVRRELVTTPEEETAVQAAADQLRSEVDAVRRQDFAEWDRETEAP